MQGEYLQYLQLVRWRTQQIRLQLRHRIRDGIEIEHDDPLRRELKMLINIARMNKFSLSQQQA